MKKTILLTCLALLLSACGATPPPTPSPTPSPTSTPLASPSPTTVYVTPTAEALRAPVTAQQTECLRGTWHQSSAEVASQYRQLITAFDIGMVNGTIDFTFSADGTQFTQWVNDIELLIETPNPFPETPPDTNEMKLSGYLKGRVAKTSEGNLVFEGVDATNAKSTFMMNGQNILEGGETSFAFMPLGRTNIGVSCSGNRMTLSYLFPARPVTVHLTR